MWDTWPKILGRLSKTLGSGAYFKIPFLAHFFPPCLIISSGIVAMTSSTTSINSRIVLGFRLLFGLYVHIHDIVYTNNLYLILYTYNYIYMYLLARSCNHSHNHQVWSQNVFFFSPSVLLPGGPMDLNLYIHKRVHPKLYVSIDM